MKFGIILKPSNKKDLNDNIYDLIDTHIEGDIQKFGVKAIYGTFNIFGENGNNALFSLVRIFFENMIKDQLKKNNIFASPRDLVLQRHGEQLHISVALTNIDYAKSINMNKQLIIKALKKRQPKNIGLGILDILKDDTDKIVFSALQSVDDKKKEAIIKLLVNKYHSKICDVMAKFLKENKIGFAVNKFTLE